MYVLSCPKCSHHFSVRGFYEPDTNATVFPDDDDNCPECGCDETVITDEYDDFEADGGE